MFLPLPASRPRFIPTQPISIICCIQNATLLSLFFYDSPTLPAGIFDDFLAIPQLESDIGTRGMASLVGASNYSGQISGRWVAELGGPWNGEPMGYCFLSVS